MTRGACCLAALLALAACGDDDDGGTAADAAPGVDTAVGAPDATPAQGHDRDLGETRLSLDLTTHLASASIDVRGGAPDTATFEIGDLTIMSVKQGAADLPFTAEGGTLAVDIGAGPATLDIAYTFADHSMFDGWDPAPAGTGYSLLWPYFCGNLFPCDSRPVDGSPFTLDITGVPAGMTAVYPTTIPGEAPSYMPAVTVGMYTYLVIGTTTAGTEVGVYYLPGGLPNAMTGAGKLDQYFNFYEQTLGPYLYGDHVASVSVTWGPGQYGGMEHHPLWHISTNAMTDRNTHAHEAAHGWFGNGIRLRCWEDFVLSEGVASYLAARAIAAVDGPTAGDQEWAAYQTDLDSAVAGEDTLAWPTDACNSIDILNHPVWSTIPYMKGAFFMKAVEDAVGTAALDHALHVFYMNNMGGAAGMQDLLDTIQAETGFDPGPLATAWLRSLGTPQ